MGIGGLFILGDSLTPALAIADVEIDAEVEEAALRIAQDMLDYAKANAPWEDRTGDARQGLNVAVDNTVDEITISLYHTVTYGIWLETIEDGRFAILMPTVDHFASSFLNTETYQTTQDGVG